MRRVVRDFANDMEEILCIYDNKSYWSQVDISYLLGCLRDQVEKLDNAIATKTDIKNEAVDVANFAMMIWDNS